MSPASRKIVFHVPSLMPEDAARRRGEPSRSLAALPSGEPGRLAAERPEVPEEEGGDVRKLATLLEVSQTLAGTLNLQAGLYGVLEVLERRCGTRRSPLCSSFNVDMPICAAVYRVLYENAPPRRAVAALLEREPGSELH